MLFPVGGWGPTLRYGFHLRCEPIVLANLGSATIVLADSGESAIVLLPYTLLCCFLGILIFGYLADTGFYKSYSVP